MRIPQPSKGLGRVSVVARSSISALRETSAQHSPGGLGGPPRLRFGSTRRPRVRQGSLAQSCNAPLHRPQSARHNGSVIIGRSWWFRCTANARWSRGWRCEWAKQGKLELQGPASELLLVGAVCPMAPGMRRSKAEAGKRRRTLALETLESQVSRAKPAATPDC